MMDVKATREELGLTQAELALRLGVTQGTISRFETGTLRLDKRTELALEALKREAKPQPKAPPRPFSRRHGGGTEVVA